MPLPDRFWAKVDRSGGPDACWIWTASTLWDGHGMFSFEGRNHYAHRLAAEDAGFDMSGVIHHRCETPACVNPHPSHLEALPSQSEHARLHGANGTHNSRKTHCKQGHPYSGANLIVRANGYRECRACTRAANGRWRAKRDAA